MSTKQLVHNLLVKDPRYRDNDDLLLFKALQLEGVIYFNGTDYILNLQAVLKRKSPYKNIDRAIRKVKEEHPELKGSQENQDARKLLAIQAKDSHGESITNREY